MTVAADPDELERLAAIGRGQVFSLDHTARWLGRTARWHRVSTPDSGVDARAVTSRLDDLTDALLDLDRWVLRVAATFRAADTTGLTMGLLALGARHPATPDGPGPPQPPTRAAVGRMTDEELAAFIATPALPGPWRDVVQRERVRRWARQLDERLAALPADDTGGGLVGGLARWVDDRLVDRLSVVADLHITRDEAAARLRAEVAGARHLLADPDLTVWSFDVVDGRPTMRVAFGDVDAASHLAVLLPGTGSGLHAVGPTLDDAAALHDHASRVGAAGTAVATLLDLYAAPPDLGAAADPGPSRAAGAATAAFLADLPTAPRTTLVGHSYGALAAARASDDHPVADLVLLGAPGAGVRHRSDLAGAERVWAAQAAGDPITAVADLDEHLAHLPADWLDGPLADPLVAHGPDPADPDFGALRLATAADGPGIAQVSSRGHLDYLRPGTVTLDNVARVVVGRAPEPSGP